MVGGIGARRMGGAEWVMLGGLSLIWGGSFLFAALALAALPPLVIATVRVGIGALALWTFALVLGKPVPRGLGTWARLAPLGALNNALPFALIVWAQGHIPSGLASILNATTPLFTVVAAHFLTRDERLSGLRLAGIGFGIAGVAVLVGPAALGGLGEDALAEVAVLCAACSYALAAIYGRRFGKAGLDPIATAIGQVTWATILLAPAALIVEAPWTLGWPPARVVAALLALGLVSTAFAYVIYFRLLASAGATNVLLVTFLVPASAVLLGALVLGERLAPRHFGGMALIGAGLAAIDGRIIGRLRGWRPGRR